MAESRDGPARSIDNLSASERGKLSTAQQRLTQAVKNYARFERRAPLRAGEEAPSHDFEEMLAAQKEVREAEADLWKLRETLLGWHRPTWAPAATQVSDWFLEEEEQGEPVQGQS
jgi:hypothetical protein